MKTIKILYIIFFFFLRVTGQTTKQDSFVPENHNLRYTIVFQATSPDKKWTVFRKAYEQNRDTIVLVNHKDPSIVKTYTGVQKYFFTGQSNLLLVKKTGAELHHPGAGILKRWDNLSKSEYLKPLGKFIVLHQKEGSKTDLELWSEDQLTATFQDVDQFYINSGQLFFLRTQAGKTSLYGPQKPEEPIYSTTGKLIVCLWSANGASCWMEDNDGKRDVVYVNPDHDTFHIRDHFNLDFNSANVTPIVSGSRFFLKFSYTKPNSAQPASPDIWYTKDPKLEIKFHAGEAEQCAIWEPALNRVKIVGDDKGLEAVDIENSNYLVCFDPFTKQDYRNQYADVIYYRYNIKDNNYSLLGDGSYRLLSGSTGRFFLSNPDNQWSLYDVNTLSVKKLKVDDLYNAYFSEDDKFILFEVVGGFLKYQIDKGTFVKIPLLDGFYPSIISTTKLGDKSNRLIGRKSTYNSQRPLLLKMYDKVNDKTAVLSYASGKILTLVAPTRHRIETLEQQNDQLISYTSEDYNVPFYITAFNGKKAKVIYKSNPQDTLACRFRAERISYTNSEGVKLTGILYYPVDYKENSTYPMIVSVYERQSHFGNQYLRDGFFERTEGLNIRSYLEKSYFVFLPSIVFNKSGTGFSALDCVNRALDALSAHKAIDFKRLGLIGHSHGGYETNFIATHSDRFATYASGAGNSDLVRSYFSYNYEFLKPFYFQFETGQYKMPGSFEDYKELYIQNSPIYAVSKINAPIFLWTGMRDRNIDWNQVMEFYLGLKRNKKDAVALFYPDEAHGFWKRPNQLDIAQRLKDWFDYFLKDKKNIPWIDQQMQKPILN